MSYRELFKVANLRDTWKNKKEEMLPDPAFYIFEEG